MYNLFKYIGIYHIIIKFANKTLPTQNIRIVKLSVNTNLISFI